MKTLVELAFKCDPIYAMVADVKTLYEYTKDQPIKSYELDEDDKKNFATGTRKMFNNGKLVHYDYIYHLDHDFFRPFTLKEETKIQESGEAYSYIMK